MPRTRSKRRSHAAAAAHQPSKRTRTKQHAEPGGAANTDVTPASAAHSAPSSSSSSSSPSYSPSSFLSCAAAFSPSSASHTGHPAAWPSLPLELLLLVADCVPSWRLLLPLSSTCRRLYELIHEEDAAGAAQAANVVHDVAVRLSCWRHHPPVRVSITRSHVKVDGSADLLLERRHASFVSHVLTSLRCVPHLELVYSCPGGPHAAYFYPLRHFTRLRWLTLLWGDQDRTNQHIAATNLSTALLSLPSLVSLTAIQSAPGPIHAQMLESSTLQRLASERLLHISLNAQQCIQLTTPDSTLGRRSRKQLPLVYPRVVSVALIHTLTVVELLGTFPNVQHLTLGRRTRVDALPPLISLHMDAGAIWTVFSALKDGAGGQLRCLSLRMEQFLSLEFCDHLSSVLLMLPHLTQLAITGNHHWSGTPATSIFSGTDSLLLPQLTYLQFTGGLLAQDIDFLLSAASAPAFAASLTHLALCVQAQDRQLAAARLSLLPALYPSLQKCHIGLQPSSIEDEKDRCVAAVAAVRSQLGSVWCDSEEAVRMVRADVAWRRSAGLPNVSDGWAGEVMDGELRALRSQLASST